MRKNKRGCHLQLILPLGIKQLMRPLIIRFAHEHFGRPIQVAVIRLGWINQFLRRDDAVFFEHHDEHLGIDDRAGVEKLHVKKLTTTHRAEASAGGMRTNGRPLRSEYGHLEAVGGDAGVCDGGAQAGYADLLDAAVGEGDVADLIVCLGSPAERIIGG